MVFSNFFSLTRDIEFACRCSCSITDSAFIRAIVGRFQLELQLWCLLQVGHWHPDEIAITKPADICQTGWIGSQDCTPQSHHLIVPRTHILEDWVQYRRICKDNRTQDIKPTYFVIKPRNWVKTCKNHCL